jgi:hypothetical protein
MRKAISWSYFSMAFMATSVVCASGDFNGYVGGRTNQIAPSVGDVAGNRFLMDLSFDYYRHRPGLWEKRFTVNALVNDENAVMYTVNEAYLINRWGRSELQIGRAILDWSDVDAHWGFGKINHRQNFNYFEPGHEGLIGMIFKRRHANGIRYHLFGSPLYVPELNPSLDINKSDGTITSKNPWAKPPARTARISSSDVPIFYDVDMPQLSQVIFRPSGGANIGWENKHWEAGFYYLRKPENQTSTTVDVSVNVTNDLVNARVTPQFYYHDIYGGNLRWKNKDATIYTSAIAIRPNTYPDGDLQAAQYTQIEVEKRREDYVGGGIAQENDTLGMGFDYVARLSPFNRSEDILAEDPRWNQAVHGWVRYTFNSHFMTSFDGKYDMLTTDRLVMIQATYYPSRVVALNVGVNMIGTPSNGKSYWSPYTNNDAAYAGLRYLF